MKAKTFWMVGLGAMLLGVIAVALAAPSTETTPEVTKDFTVHEWGTFTSVFGSDGSILPGLEVEEERLPPFVYGLDALSGKMQLGLEGGPKNQPIFKGFLRQVKNVTVKMETPVIYFYSEEEFDAEVKVGFEGGSLSQWYPGRSGGELTRPPITLDGKLPEVDFAKKHKGAIEWKVRVEKPSANSGFEVMKPGETANWLHPRAPKSNILKTPSGETESYLFYRGLGNFPQPIDFQVIDNRLVMSPKKEIPFALVVESTGSNQGRILWKGKPSSKEQVSLKTRADDASYPSDAYESLHEALVEAGLFEDEAAAMLRTWWHSYFGQPGLRVFWIVPRESTDEILPLKMNPKPAHLERVLLGRSEILTPAFEEEIVSAFNGDPKKNLFQNHRYFKAYEARANQIKPQRPQQQPTG